MCCWLINAGIAVHIDIDILALNVTDCQKIKQICFCFLFSQSFNGTLTNDIDCFEQLGPVVKYYKTYV